MIDLAGKTAVVFGLANKRSIAWGIAQKLHAAGATLAICYQNDRMKLEAEDLIKDLPGASGFQCDVSVDEEIDALFATLKEKYAKLDILVHAVAFAPANRTPRRVHQHQPRRLPRRHGRQRLLAHRRHPRRRSAHDRRRQHHDLTYYAAEKVVPNYNVMAVAKAGLECTDRYLAVEPRPEKHPRQRHLRRPHQNPRGSRHRRPERHDAGSHAERAPLHRNVDQLEVGGAALFLASDLSSAITGETLYVDCGYNVMGF